MLLELKSPFVNGQLLMQAGDHLADTGFGQTFVRAGVLVPQTAEPGFQVFQFCTGLLILLRVSNHRLTSTTPLRRLFSSRVRVKNSTQADQSTSSSAANKSPCW